MKTTTRLLILAALSILLVPSAFAAATIFIINNDGPNEGFNDPTPVMPVGGNAGTTRGQQRQNAFAHAANIWADSIDSNVEIWVVAAFNPLGTNVLGSAGAWDVFSDFEGDGLHPGSEFPETWYSSALADKRAGYDHDVTAPDLNAQFSSNFNFYLGLDGNHGPLNDLVTVLLHELGHGLGFQNFVNESTGSNLGNFVDSGRFYPLQTDVYSRYTLDTTNGLLWSNMTQTERRSSAVRFGRVVWNGPAVTAAAPGVLSFGSPQVSVVSPAAIAGPYQFGTANFGPGLSDPGVTALVVPAADAADAAGPESTDGCSPFLNAAAVANNIALVERGTCGFAVKARNAAAAGARAVIIYNNAANVNAAPPGMADDGGPAVTIPAVSLTRADGLTVISQLAGGVTASIGVDMSIRAGANAANQVRLYMPFPVSGGSSGSHYDTAASRNLLMEPSINADLTHSLAPPEDLTLPLMRDVGWFPDLDLDGLADELDETPASDRRPTVILGSCDSGVANPMFESGSTLTDRIVALRAQAANHGQFMKSVNELLNELKKSGQLTGEEKDALTSCAASS